MMAQMKTCTSIKLSISIDGCCHLFQSTRAPWLWWVWRFSCCSSYLCWPSLHATWELPPRRSSHLSRGTRFCLHQKFPIEGYTWQLRGDGLATHPPPATPGSWTWDPYSPSRHKLARRHVTGHSTPTANLEMKDN